MTGEMLDTAGTIQQHSERPIWSTRRAKPRHSYQNPYFSSDVFVFCCCPPPPPRPGNNMITWNDSRGHAPGTYICNFWNWTPPPRPSWLDPCTATKILISESRPKVLPDKDVENFTRGVENFTRDGVESEVS